MWSPIAYLFGVYFHPLARIPGPKLAGMFDPPLAWKQNLTIAACTYWPEIYYDVFLGGQFFRAIDDMHAEYGMSTSAKALREADTPVRPDYSNQSRRSAF